MIKQLRFNKGPQPTIAETVSIFRVQPRSKHCHWLKPCLKKSVTVLKTISQQNCKLLNCFYRNTSSPLDLIITKFFKAFGIYSIFNVCSHFWLTLLYVFLLFRFTTYKWLTWWKKISQWNLLHTRNVQLLFSDLEPWQLKAVVWQVHPGSRHAVSDISGKAESFQNVHRINNGAIVIFQRGQ